MTYTEAKDILDQRINWRNTNNTLTAANTTTDSGRVFQDEHSAVTLDNIKACQPEVGINDADFNTYLTQLRHAAIYQVLADVYGSENKIVQDELDCNVDVFDNAISLKMVLKVAELIITSTRSNYTESLTKDFVNQLMVDVNGHVDAKSGGFKNLYKTEVRTVKRFLKKPKRIASITTG